MGNMKKLDVALILGFLALALAVLLFVPKFTGYSVEGGEEYEGGLLLALDYVNLFAVVLSAIILLIIIRKYTEGSLQKVWIYFLGGTITIGLTRLFYMLADLKIMVISDVMKDIGWHSLFYLSMILFFIGGKALVSLAKDGKSVESKRKLVFWMIFSVLFILIIFSSAVSLSSWLVSNFEGSFLDKIGFVHFIAFVLAGIVSMYMYKVRERYSKVISIITTPFTLFLALYSLYHLWELLGESWGIISLSESIFERVEQVIALSAFVCLLFGFYKSMRNMSNPEE
ncbi:hypothetical protein J4423_04320 [Candidatus Pacearchaeota archaeon]|nr:hypothetical protein [Candidatus Pacearchaeota archaeon]